MKVLIISDHPQTNTGYGKLTKAWGTHLVKQGHDVMIMGGVNPQAQVPFQPTEIEGMRVWPVPGYGHAEHVRYFLTNEKPDVVLANADPRFFEYLFKMDNEVRRQCPLAFYHLWDDEPFPDFNIQHYLSCDRIICGSKFTYDLLKTNPEIAAKKFTDYVPIGINTNVYRPLSTEDKEAFKLEFDKNTAQRFEKAKFVIGYIGRHAERKQLLSILDTFHKWAEDKDDVLLFIHTPGSDQGNSLGYVMQMKYPNGKIVYSNAQPQNQTDELINKFYNSFDVLVNRSSAEGFGLPIAEAMSAGVPCISVDTAGPQNLIRPDNGWLLEADCRPLFGNYVTPYIQLRYVTDAKFTAALDAAYKDKDSRKAKADKCRDFIINNYSEKAMCIGLERSLVNAINNWIPYPEYTLTSWPANAGRPASMTDMNESNDGVFEPPYEKDTGTMKEKLEATDNE